MVDGRILLLEEMVMFWFAVKCISKINKYNYIKLVVQLKFHKTIDCDAGLHHNQFEDGISLIYLPYGLLILSLDNMYIVYGHGFCVRDHSYFIVLNVQWICALYIEAH